jgi:hypothetical protein
MVATLICILIHPLFQATFALAFNSENLKVVQAALDQAAKDKGGYGITLFLQL